MNRIRRNGQLGQVGLVVLLVGAVLMTIGLGVASQSVMEISTATVETDSSQAFNMAEQGIESALQNIDPDNPIAMNISGYDVRVQTVAQRDTYQGTILEGHSAQLDMQGVTSLTLSWNDPGCDDFGHSAVIVTFIKADYSLTRQAYSRQCDGLADNFSVASCVGLTCSQVLSPVGVLFARIKAVYSDTQLTAGLAGINLPPQYYEITSTATKNSGETRSVQVNRSLASVPSIFDYALFSGTSLAQ